jgi:hypothetical protein
MALNSSLSLDFIVMLFFYIGMHEELAGQAGRFLRKLVG